VFYHPRCPFLRLEQYVKRGAALARSIFQTVNSPQILFLFTHYSVHLYSIGYLYSTGYTYSIGINPGAHLYRESGIDGEPTRDVLRRARWIGILGRSGERTCRVVAEQAGVLRQQTTTALLLCCRCVVDNLLI
jgi:hypothetical protein